MRFLWAGSVSSAQGREQGSRRAASIPGSRNVESSDCRKSHTHSELLSLCTSLLAEAQSSEGRLITLPDLAGVLWCWVIDA